ncbi:hypothetical protein E4U41_000995 [Claviceps citrina]|nr:hypothetical protein E4U41_000995 [Claviceps citrina]
MKFSAVFVSSAVMAGFALAVPTTNQVLTKGFDIVALRAASPIHEAHMSAARKGLLLNLPKQNATCKSTTKNWATFHLEGSKLFLYSDDPEQQQLLFTDRSGMGQGLLGYVNAGDGLPRNAEVDGWSVDANGVLTFDGAGLQACPGATDGAWRVWLDGLDRPGFSDGCVHFVARTVPLLCPASCHYN